MTYLIQPLGRSWTTRQLAFTLCDMLYGRGLTPCPHPEKSRQGSWDINGQNNILVHPVGEGDEATRWRISCRSPLSEAVVAFLGERIGPIGDA